MVASPSEVRRLQDGSGCSRATQSHNSLMWLGGLSAGKAQPDAGSQGTHRLHG